MGLAPTRIDAMLRALRGSRGVGDASLGIANVIFLALKSLELDRLVEEGERGHMFLAVEEPEAHLRPLVQRLVYRYFLKEPEGDDDEAPSRLTTILTTHSPHIASVAPIRSIVLLRHVYRLLETDAGRGAANDLDLAADCVRHAWMFFNSPDLNLATAAPGSVTLSPNREMAADLARDYTAMAGIIFGEAPPFGEILERGADFEADANAMGRTG